MHEGDFPIKSIHLILNTLYYNLCAISFSQINEIHKYLFNPAISCITSNFSKRQAIGT